MSANKSVYCVLAWRWKKGETIQEAYVEEIVGPFESRSIAQRWATKRRKHPNRAAVVFILKPCCEECVDE